MGPFSNHICLVFEPLREPLWLLKEILKGNAIPSELLKIMLQIFMGLITYMEYAELSMPVSIYLDLEQEDMTYLIGRSQT